MIIIALILALLAIAIDGGFTPDVVKDNKPFVEELE